MNDTFAIKKASFFKSMKNTGDYPGGDMPEIAVTGKSNAGKSSLINYLANNSKLAYVSKQPGKTRLINYFIINGNFYLVDLPGYGFARVSKSEKKSWSEMMQGYFDITRALKGMILLTDIRHLPSEDDVLMARWAAHYGIPLMIAATKADKVAKSKRINYLRKIVDAIRKGAEIEGEISAAAVSALQKSGGEKLLEFIGDKTGDEV